VPTKANPADSTLLKSQCRRSLLRVLTMKSAKGFFLGEDCQEAIISDSWITNGSVAFYSAAARMLVAAVY